MDVNWARSLFTVLVFISFILLLYIVLSKKNKANYDEVSRIVIDDHDTPHEDAVVQASRDNGVNK